MNHQCVNTSEIRKKFKSGPPKATLKKLYSKATEAILVALGHSLKSGTFRHIEKILGTLDQRVVDVTGNKNSRAQLLIDASVTQYGERGWTVQVSGWRDSPDAHPDYFRRPVGHVTLGRGRKKT